jgi:hypothetical protein
MEEPATGAVGVDEGGVDGKMRGVRRPGYTEPHWPALLALLALGGLYAVLPPSLLVGGPRWLLLGAVSALLVPTVISRLSGNHSLNQVLGYVLNVVVTVAVIWSVVLLVKTLSEHTATARQLLLSTVALWVSNVLVFASWYWRLDAGGPHKRDLTPGHDDGAFLFAQMTMEPRAKIAAGEQDWSPNFIDYLFLAFHASTAFSPTDAPVLSRWAKVLMMIQTMISLMVIAFLAGRAFDLL